MFRDWKRALFSFLLVAGVSWGLWAYNSHRTVDIQLRAQVEIKDIEKAQTLALNFLDANGKTIIDTKASIKDAHGVSYQKITLKPGSYKVHAVIEKSDQNHVFIEKEVEIPSQDAELTVFFRK